MNNSTGLSVKRQYAIDIAFIFAICILFFVVLEIRFPYFFLTDDNADAYLCMYKHSIRSVINGEFPFYDFHQFCGKRFLGIGQTGSFNPFVYIAAFISHIIFGYIDASLDIMAMILILTGSAGTYLFLRELGCSRIPAMIGAVGWNMNSYNIYIGDAWIIVIMTTSLLPWIYYGSLKLHLKHSVTNFLLAVISRILLFYCGHPQFFAYSVIFDLVFLLSYVLISGEANKTRLRSLLILAGEYAVSYLFVILACLPLLLPMYDLMKLSERSEKLTFEQFIASSSTSDIGSSFLGFCGIISLIFTVLGLMLVIVVAVKRNRYLKEYKKEISGMLAALPVGMITFLWMRSITFKRIIYYVPIINRFRWPHKLTIIAVSAIIIFSSLALTVMEKYLEKKHGKTIITFSAFLAVLQIFSLLVPYMIYPRRSLLIISTSKVPYKEDYSEELVSGRYVPFMFKDTTVDPETGLYLVDTTASLSYDYASYFGLNSVTGYASGMIMNNDVFGYSVFFSLIRGSGDLTQTYPGFVEDMRKQSVKWYVTEKKNKEQMTEFFEPYGITEVYEDHRKVIFKDDLSKPLAYDAAGKEIPLTQKVNSLELMTTDDFEGGMITLVYSYDKNFICKIDGEKAELVAGESNWEMKVNCSPGCHKIEVRYVEKSFNIGLTASISGISVCIILLVLFRKKTKTICN